MNGYDGRPAHSRTPAPTRIFTAATTNKPAESKTTMCNHITKIIRGSNKKRKKTALQ
jgi:hypothetical protein